MPNTYYPIRIKNDESGFKTFDPGGEDLLPLDILPFGFNDHTQDLAQIALEAANNDSGVLIKAAANTWVLSKDIGNTGLYLDSTLKWTNPPGSVIEYSTAEVLSLKLHSANSANTFISNTLFYQENTLHSNIINTGDLVVSNTLITHGNVEIYGDVLISGNTTTVNTQNLSVADAVIELRRGNDLFADDAGIQFNMVTSNTGDVTDSRTFKWDNSTQRFRVTNDGTVFSNVAVHSDKLNVFANTSSEELKSVIDDTTGSGILVFANNANLIDPNINHAIANTVNRVIITTPETSATLSLANGSSFNTNGSYDVTINAIANSNITIPESGTLAVNNQVMYIGTTEVTINRTPGILQLSGIHSIDGSAAKLTTPRTISANGDASWNVSFDGSSNVISELVLANTGVTSGDYGIANSVPNILIDSKGRIISANNVEIAITTNQISGLAPSATIDTTNANNITSGLVDTLRLGAGTASNTTFLRGDSTWAVVYNDLYYSGDVFGTGKTGSTTTLTLSNTNVTSGTYGSSNTIPVYTVDSKGRLTSASNVSILHSSTSDYGIVKLNDTITSTSISEAATANSVKTAVGVAETKLPIAGGIVTGDLRVSGNFIVDGTTTAVNINSVNFTDNFIYLRTGNDLTPSDGGFQLNLSTNSSGIVTDYRALKWSNSNNRFQITNDGIHYSNVSVYSDKLNVFANTTSIELASIITDETGTGNLVFNTNPSLIDPVITLNNTNLVKNLNSELLNGHNSSYYTNASNIITGTLNVSRMGAGTANTNTFLRGDGSWSVVSSDLLYSGDMYGTGTTGSNTVITLANTGVTAGNYGIANSIASFNVDSKGRIVNASDVKIEIDYSQVSGLSNSAVIDTTNADNITSGTINVGRMGSGTPDSSTFLRGDGSWSVVSSDLLYSGDVYGTGKTGSNTVITLANTGVTSGIYGSVNSVPVVSIDSKGRISNANSTLIQINSTQVSGLSNSAVIDTTNANNITIGLIPLQVLGTGTPTANNFLRGDGTWSSKSEVTAINLSFNGDIEGFGNSDAPIDLKLKSNSINVITGSGLSGGGVVALGSDINILANNSSLESIGVVKLNDNVFDTSVTQAATINAVKKSYDAALYSIVNDSYHIPFTKSDGSTTTTGSKFFPFIKRDGTLINLSLDSNGKLPFISITLGITTGI